MSPLFRNFKGNTQPARRSLGSLFSQTRLKRILNLFLVAKGQLKHCLYREALNIRHSRVLHLNFSRPAGSKIDVQASSLLRKADQGQTPTHTL